ncbi:hypothetical protein LWI28_009641 [Acer negundo]|uniref:Ubiquitin-like protease family profile domain-containing protein n=1 Tax=Acer negundo TaxID=4023 RepID=A0AAD5IUT5_ACENE|nr:hypothetical protein LWI28_009641 [Acer negundo]
MDGSRGVPQQHQGGNCGAHTLRLAEYLLANKKEFNWKEEDMGTIREKMAVEEQRRIFHPDTRKRHMPRYHLATPRKENAGSNLDTYLLPQIKLASPAISITPKYPNAEYYLESCDGT